MYWSYMKLYRIGFIGCSVTLQSHTFYFSRCIIPAIASKLFLHIKLNIQIVFFLFCPDLDSPTCYVSVSQTFHEKLINKWHNSYILI